MTPRTLRVARRRAHPPNRGEAMTEPENIEPTYLAIGDINGALGIIFPSSEDPDPFGQFDQPHAN
jgi:hypothetical protein